MNNKPDNINKFLNVFRSPLKILGLLSIVLLFAGIVTAYTYTNPPEARCFYNGTCVFGNTKWNETTFIAESFYATSNVTAGYHNTTDGRELQNGGCDASYCIRYNLTDGTTIEAVNGTTGKVEYSSISNTINNTKGSVKIRAGTYTNINEILPSENNIQIYGEGMLQTVLKANPSNTNLFNFTTRTRMELFDLSIDCMGIGTCINYSHSSSGNYQGELNRVYIYNATVLINATNNEETLIDHSVLGNGDSDDQEKGIEINRHGGRFTVRNTNFNNFSFAGISYNGSTDLECDSCTFTGDSGVAGLFMGSTGRVVLIDPWFESILTCNINSVEGQADALTIYGGFFSKQGTACSNINGSFGRLSIHGSPRFITTNSSVSYNINLTSTGNFWAGDILSMDRGVNRQQGNTTYYYYNNNSGVFYTNMTTSTG